MCYTAPIVLLALAYAYGTFIKVIVRDDDSRIGESCIIGTFFVLILWEVVTLIYDRYIKIDNIFDIVKRTYTLLLIGIFILAASFVYKRVFKKIKIEKSIEKLPIIIVAAVLVFEFMGFFIFHPDIRGDLSVETVNTITVTNNFFDYDYATGQIRESALTLKEKFNVLPLFYSYLTDVFKENASIVVFRCVPMWVLALSFMSYGLWAEMLFGNDEKKSLREALFLVGVGMINLCGTFSENSIFYYQSMKGFSSNTFCYTIIIPFTIYEFYSLFSNHRIKCLVYILLAGVTALFVSSFANGLIPFGISSLLCVLIAIGYKVRRKMRWRK